MVLWQMYCHLKLKKKEFLTVWELSSPSHDDDEQKRQHDDGDHGDHDHDDVREHVWGLDSTHGAIRPLLVSAALWPRFPQLGVP